MPRSLWLGLVLMSLAAELVAASVPLSAVGVTSAPHELAGWKPIARDFPFSQVPHFTLRISCEEVRSPQGLTTPTPVFIPGKEINRVKVSFIVGIDGRVRSPLILESAGPKTDRNVLRTIRSWRYRPATCNGIPTETEGKVEFSSH
jgi:TonB family protein